MSGVRSSPHDGFMHTLPWGFRQKHYFKGKDQLYANFPAGATSSTGREAHCVQGTGKVDISTDTSTSLFLTKTPPHLDVCLYNSCALNKERCFSCVSGAPVALTLSLYYPRLSHWTSGERSFANFA